MEASTARPISVSLLTEVFTNLRVNPVIGAGFCMALARNAAFVPKFSSPTHLYALPRRSPQRPLDAMR